MSANCDSDNRLHDLLHRGAYGGVDDQVCKIVQRRGFAVDDDQFRAVSSGCFGQRGGRLNDEAGSKRDEEIA